MGTSPDLAYATGECQPTGSSYVADGTNGTDGVTYQVLTFSDVGSCEWSVPEGVNTIDALVVGGGGGGGGKAWAGGGGAGGVLYGDGIDVADYVTDGDIAITVGDGGDGGSGDSGDSSRGSNGGLSQFGSVQASGGGGGGGVGWDLDYDGSGAAGGSGGGVGEHGSSSEVSGELLYALDDPSRDSTSNSLQYRSGYGLDPSDAAATFDGESKDITRVSYRMKLTLDGEERFAEVRFDPWKTGLTAKDLRVPDLTTNERFEVQEVVKNMVVDSNMSADVSTHSDGVTNARGQTGYLELWPWNFSGIPSDGTDSDGDAYPLGGKDSFDFNDSPSVGVDDHGSFQVHNVTSVGSEETVISWTLHRKNEVSEIGLGNQSSGNPDWTLTENSLLEESGYLTNSWSFEIRVNKEPFRTLLGGTSNLSAPTGWTAYGNVGGQSDTMASQAGSGGGGAGAAGGDVPFTSRQTIAGVEQDREPGDGGAGQAFNITGASVDYAGGGGGATSSATDSVCSDGGSGGGGAGACGNERGASGTDGLGGGGGGSMDSKAGGDGGSGVVIVRYALNSGEPSITIGSPLQVSGSTVSIPVTVNNILSGNYQAFVSVPEGAGTLSITSSAVTALFGYDSTSFTRSSGRELGFTGSLSEVQGALDTLIFTPASGTPETELTVSVTQAPSGSNAQNIYYFPDNGHYYEFVNQEDSIRWDDARDGASQKSLFGMDGYLVTITSLPEQDFVRNQIDAPNIWIGATDRFDLINAARGDSFFSGQRTGNQPSEGKWHWVTGPEAGTQFWEPGTSGEFDTQRRGLGGQSVDSEFSAWCSEEPNDHNQREHYAAANFNCRVGPTSFEYNWNDFSIEQEPTSYLVEYGGVDGEVSTAISTATTQWVVPEAPTGVTGVTGDGEFTFSWSAASDSADFVTNFEYRLDAGSWVSLGSTATEVTVAVDDVCEALVFEVRAVIGSQSGPESDDFTVSGCNTITVVDSGGAAEGSGWNFSGGVFKAIQDVSINAGVVESELAEGSVVIDAQNITVDGGIEFSGSNSLTLRAAESVELRANIDSDGPITIYSDAISVQAALAATNDTITFQGAGSDDSKGTLSNTSDGTITADNLLIRNIHNASLHSHENVSVNTVASTGGYRLLLANDQALEVGTVSGVNGVSATEWVAIDTTTGDLSITQPVGTTLTTSSWGLRLRAGTDTAFGTASGGDVTVAGSGAINVPNAQTQVFSGSAAGSTGLSALSTTEVVSEVAPTVAAGEVGVAYRAGPPAFSSATTMRFDDELTLLATDPAGSSVTYSKVSGDCSLDGSTVEPTGVGDCVMRATASGSGLTTDTTISISKAPQSIAFTSSVPTSAVSGTRYTPSATATSGLTVEFAITSGSPSVCTLAGGVVEFQSAGSCTIEASIADGQSGAANYLAATAVSQTIVAGKINQTISFSVIADRNYGDPSFAAGATVSSGRTVTYSSPGSSSSVCRVNSSTGVVVILDVGDCTVTASSAGDSSYASAADVTRTFTVRAVVPGKASLTSASFGDQRITVGFVAPESNGGAAITGYRALATPAGGGSAIQQTCGSVSPCTVSGLTNGTGYTVTLAAINSAGAASASDASPAVTPATAPDSVSNLRTSPGNEQLVVAWTRAENFGGGTFTAYEVYLRESGQSWPGSATQTMSSESDETVTLTGLTNGTAYDVKVVTVSSANQTEIAGTNLAVAFGVPVTVADAPTGLSVTALSSTTALASWKAPADNGGTVITAYSVSPGCDFDTATDAYCTLTGLTPSSSVTVSVGATNFVGTGATTQAVVAMPAAPRNDSGNNDSDDSDDSPAQVVAPPMSPSAVPTADQPRRLPVGPGPAVRPDVVTGPVQLPGGPSGTLANPRGFVGGIPAPVRTTPSADGGFDVSASTLRLDLRPGATPGGSASVPGENALPAVTPGDSAGASSESMRLLVPQGGSTAFRGGGLLPGSSLQVFLPGSSGGGGGAELARIPVNTSGEFDGEVGFGRNLDQMPLPIGEQVLQAVGYDENGNQVVVELPVNIAQGAPTPEWDREAGAVPELTAGQVLATSAGLPESVTITALPEIGQVNAVAGDWSFSIRVAEDAGSVEQAGSSANVRLIRDRAAEASGSGFQPGTRVDMWLFSEPTLLGSVTVGDDGEFVGEFFLDPRFATVGEHTLQLQGVGTDGFVKAVNMGVTVDDAVGATSTGANTLLWWALGVFLAIVIALVLFALLSRRSQRA